MSASIGGGLGIKPVTVRAASSKHGAVDHSATLLLVYVLCVMDKTYSAGNYWCFSNLNVLDSPNYVSQSL